MESLMQRAGSHRLAAPCGRSAGRQQQRALRVRCSGLLPSDNVNTRLQVARAASALEVSQPADGLAHAGAGHLLLPKGGGGSAVLPKRTAGEGSSNVLSFTRKRRRPRIAVDVDEVLGRFVHALNIFCREEHALHYDVSDYHVYDFATVWNCTQDESNHIVHGFFKSHHFANGIPPIPGALESLIRLVDDFELVVVTSRQHVIRECTLRWLEEHFPGVFSECYFGNHFALEGPSKKKSEICREVGASVLVDDNPRYALECAEAGLQVLLYDWEDSYPWSKTPCGPTHPNIMRVRDWEHVEAALNVWAVEQEHAAPKAGAPPAA